jgi:hypothetical protein
MDASALAPAIASLDDQSAPAFDGVISALADKVGVALLCLDRIAALGVGGAFLHVFESAVSGLPDDTAVGAVFSRAALLPPTFGLSRAIAALVRRAPALTATHASAVRALLPLAFATDDDSVRRSVLEVCAIAGVDSRSHSLLRQALDFPCDRWAYRPEQHAQSRTGLLGLRNLGATCFVNAVLQQFFHAPPFRAAVLADGADDEARVCLRRLFTEMRLSRRKFADTQPFCRAWREWHGRAIDPREQQDVFEFLQLFLEGIPDVITAPFRGTIRNCIEGVNEDFMSAHAEPFWEISLEVKGFAKIQDSITSFFQPQVIRYAVGGRTIDARKFVRVEETPMILIVQLKRFEYNMQTLAREKIRAKYEFQQRLEIGNAVYHLKGVIIHSGTAQGGHYASVIRIGGKWIEFDDTEVDTITDAEFEAKAFGGQIGADQFDPAPCAYILFYQREDVMELDEDAQCDPDMAEDVERSNREFLQCQTLFRESVFEFMAKTQDDELMLMYFVNVFCHSALAQRALEMDDAMEEIIRRNHPRALELAMVQSSAILLNCRVPEIHHVFCNFIRGALQGSDAFGFVETIFGLLPKALALGWHQIAPIAEVVSAVCIGRTDFVSAAVDAGWARRIVEFIGAVYARQRASVLIHGIDLSSLFRLLGACLEARQDESVLTLLQYTHQIYQGALHAEAYCEVLAVLHSQKVITTQALMANLPSGEARFQAVMLVLLRCKDEQAVDTLISAVSTEVGGWQFLSKLQRSISANDQTAEFIRRFPRNTIFRFLIDRDRDTRLLALTVGKDLVRDVPTRLTANRPQVSERALHLLRQLEAEALMHMAALDASEFAGGLFVFYLKFLKWLIRAIGTFESSCFESVRSFYEKLKNAAHDPSDLVTCAGILAIFPSALFAPLFAAVYRDVFEPLPDDGRILSAFKKFACHFSDASLSDVLFLAKHSSFSAVTAKFPNARQVHTVSHFLESLARFPETHAILAQLFLDGFARASFCMRPTYLRLLRCLALGRAALETVAAFVSATITSPAPDRLRLLYCFELSQIADLSFPMCGSVLRYAARNSDSQFEGPLCGFLSRIRAPAQLLVEAEKSFITDADGHWGTAALVAVFVRVIVGADFLRRWGPFPSATPTIRARSSTTSWSRPWRRRAGSGRSGISSG